MNEAIAGVVVLHYPDKDELKKNIASYLPYVAQLIIIDNTPGGAGLNEHSGSKITSIINGQNLGIAVALNQGAELAIKGNHRWLLTMDQDSFFKNEEIEKLMRLFRHRFINDDSVAIVAPSSDSKFMYKNEEFVTETAVITSGNLLNLAAWKKIGGFENKLFIDEVDHDYCYRANNLGFKIMRCTAVQLDHNLGTKKETGYAGVIYKSKRIIHSPQRVYFMVRNYLYVRRKYKSQLPDEFKTRDKMMLTAIKNNLFFSGHFFQTLKGIGRGYRDFKRKNFEATL